MVTFILRYTKQIPVCSYLNAHTDTYLAGDTENFQEYLYTWCHLDRAIRDIRLCPGLVVTGRCSCPSCWCKPLHLDKDLRCIHLHLQSYYEKQMQAITDWNLKRFPHENLYTILHCNLKIISSLSFFSMFFSTSSFIPVCHCFYLCLFLLLV